MKLRTFKLLAVVILATWLAISSPIAFAAPTSEVTPIPEASAAPKSKKSKQPKERQDTGDPSLPPKPPKVRKAKDVPLPIPEGRPAHNVSIPSYLPDGSLTSLIKAVVMTPIDKEHVKMEAAHLKLNSPDGKDNYEIDLPLSIINMKTNTVSSDQPVTIRTKDFELTGEKMDFDTVERNGELRGHVHMRIHNIKQLSTPGGDTPAPK